MYDNERVQVKVDITEKSGSTIGTQNNKGNQNSNQTQDDSDEGEVTISHDEAYEYAKNKIKDRILAIDLERETLVTRYNNLADKQKKESCSKIHKKC